MNTPPDIRTVLVSTDFSDYGDAAIEHAARLAKDYRARLVLVHVLDAHPTPNPLYAHYYPIPTPEQVRQAEAKATEALRARVPEGLRSSERVELRIGHGAPALELLRIVAEEDANLS